MMKSVNLCELQIMVEPSTRNQAIASSSEPSSCVGSSIQASCTSHTGAEGGPCSGHSRPVHPVSPVDAGDTKTDVSSDTKQNI